MSGSGVGLVPAFIDARRSIRAFTARAVPRDRLDTWITAACTAPAPHHSRPWRFVVVDSATAKQSLARGMGDAWRADLAGDGVAAARIDELIDESHRKIVSAPALVLGCLTWDGLDRYPDAARQQAEFGMALLSLGAAVENLMLACAADGWASCWIAAPIFCPDAARDALALPREWRPHAMVVLGEPDPGYVARPRPPIPLADLRLTR
jgi:coenzyme F420-0:L-glutamate ligase/coenzyme F420-1:gamma-L-glutamate ligase